MVLRWFDQPPQQMHRTAYDVVGRCAEQAASPFRRRMSSPVVPKDAEPKRLTGVSRRKAVDMPGPQSAMPKPVIPSRPRRRFTVEQANKALPLVSRIARDIMRAHTAVMELQEKLTEGLTAKQQQSVQQELEQQSDKLASYLDELQDIGCECKDYTRGLIDFIGRHQGREVCLCWMPGEAQIGFWHELTAGFAGRQPISQLEEDE
jgi:hypothetical protein